jgi:hypothetical protein
LGERNGNSPFFLFIFLGLLKLNKTPSPRRKRQNLLGSHPPFWLEKNRLQEKKKITQHIENTCNHQTRVHSKAMTQKGAAEKCVKERNQVL